MNNMDLARFQVVVDDVERDIFIDVKFGRYRAAYRYGNDIIDSDMFDNLSEAYDKYYKFCDSLKECLRYRVPKNLEQVPSKSQQGGESS